MTGNVSRRRLEEAEKKKKKVLYAVTGFILCYLLFFFLFGEGNVFRYFSMRKAWHQTEADIARLKEENIRLKREADALRSDPAAIENLAREELGLTKKGEIIYEFPKESDSSHRGP